MAGSNGKTRPSTLFDAAQFDAGEIEGLGHVIVREVVLEDLWEFMGLAAQDPAGFSRYVLAASIEIDGERIPSDKIGRLPFTKYRKLQDLLPKVLEINGLGNTLAAAGAVGNADAAVGPAADETEEASDTPPA